MKIETPTATAVQVRIIRQYGAIPANTVLHGTRSIEAWNGDCIRIPDSELANFTANPSPLLVRNGAIASKFFELVK